MIFKRYLFKTNLLYSSGICAILIFLIWFSRVNRFVSYITENGIEVSKFINLFLLILPWLLMIIIPISLFVGTLINFNRLKNNNEITILKNSGLTKLQICQPIIFLAIICSLICYFIAFFLMPYANRILKESRMAINENYTNIAFKSQTFESFKDLTIYSKKRDEKNNLFEIFLHDRRSSEYGLTITASKGKIVIRNKSAFLEMELGTVQKFNYKDRNSEIMKFDNYLFNLSESTKVNHNNKLKANEYYFHELLNPPDNLTETEYKKIKSEIHERLIDPLLSLVLVLIALSLILKGEFKRNGNANYIIYSILTASTYFMLNILSYSFIKYSSNLAILPYLNFIIFVYIALEILRKNYRIKNAH
jgi:lipopolysaccharide export system permease protein